MEYGVLLECAVDTLLAFVEGKGLGWLGAGPPPRFVSCLGPCCLTAVLEELGAPPFGDSMALGCCPLSGVLSF